MKQIPEGIQETVLTAFVKEQLASAEAKMTTCSLGITCPTPYASRHACSRTDAGVFWTCIKIAKALKEFDGKE